MEITGSPDAVVTIADFSAAQHGVRLSTGDLGGQPNGRHGLALAADLSAKGRFTVPLRGVFAFDDAARAHRLSAERGGHGKTVLIPRY